MHSSRQVAVLDDYQGVALTSADWGPVDAQADVTVFRSAFHSEADAMEALQAFEVLCVMRERFPLTERVLAALPRLRCVVTTGAANRSIDLDAAERHGVVVSATTNGMGRLATAELTWGLVLAAVRGIPQQDRAVRDGRWQVSMGSSLRGKTLGIMGLGGVGRYVARFGRCFEMEVLAWSKNLTEERAAESMAQVVTKAELLERSDVVSVHLVLSPETTRIIDAAALDLMKPSGFLVNTSRGALVDEDALMSALRTGGIAGAALDVFDQEPLPQLHPYRQLDNVVLSPHVGYVTEEVYAEFYRETVRSTAAYLEGRPIRLLTGGKTQETPIPRRYEDG